MIVKNSWKIIIKKETLKINLMCASRQQPEKVIISSLVGGRIDT